jgi:hypothetical protein
LVNTFKMFFTRNVIMTGVDSMVIFWHFVLHHLFVVKKLVHLTYPSLKNWKRRRDFLTTI